MTSLVWLPSRRNLGWRPRRFVIAVIGITSAFALTLLLSGFRDGSEDRVMVVATHDDRLDPIGYQVLDLSRHEERRL